MENLLKENKYIMELYEEQIFEDGPKDITDKFILKNVKLIGIKSDNQRTYPIEVLRESKDLYHDVPVYMGHQRNGSKRIYSERIGVIKNPYCKDSGLYGELHLNPFHAQAEALQWDYANNSKQVALSHDAQGETVKGVVRKLIKINSVDLVTDPATTISLKEEKEVNELELIKSELNLLNTKIDDMGKENKRLLEEMNELKTRKQIRSVTPAYEPEKFDTTSWVKELKGK